MALTWISRTSAADYSWNSITYGNGLFVAVALSGTGDRVMTSPDGITWTIRTSAADNSWRSVTYGNGLFVAVAGSGAGNRVMTSPDGISWTIRTSAANLTWQSVTYANGLFVAVAMSGTGDRVMTSPDGISWTQRVHAVDNQWNSVTYGNGLFVAVAASGTGDRVMTSPDGITWTIGTSAANLSWRSVTYANGLFVAVASTGAGNRVMTAVASTTPTAPSNLQLTQYTATTDTALLDSFTKYESITDQTIFGGLWHLNGQTVGVVVDGMYIGTKVVSNGKIELDVGGKIVHIGLGYTGRLFTNRFDYLNPQATHGLIQRVIGIVVCVTDSGVFKYGSSMDNLETVVVKDFEGDDADILTGDIVDRAFPGRFIKDSSVLLVQDQPIPTTINAIVLEVEVGTK